MRVSKKFLAVLALIPLIAGVSACSKADKESNAPLAKPKACVKTITPASSGEVPEVKPAENAPVPEATAGKDFGQEPTIAPGSGAPSNDFIRSILIKGSGSEVSANADVVVNYVGQTWDGKVFDSSWKRGKTATFNLREVVQGWRWGLAGAHVGDRVELVIPPKLGYGELTPEEQAQKAAGKGIAGKPKLAGDTLVFVVDIVFSPPVLNEPQLAAYTQVLSKSKPTDAKLPDGLKIYCQPGEEPQPAYVEGAKIPSQPVTVWTMEGQGRTIEAGDQVGYVLVYGSWGDAPQSTWTNGSSVTWVKAEDAKAVGKKVGSRVVLVGPPNEAAKRGVVQIVDIVDAISLSEKGNTPAK
ncbi:FKBP-type peptidyl-prolyl cis-trans isomerase [Mobiluncus mulieris]|uniref:peptidylprolyl isomerase n=2 Tax=Mobiluncus mulieris TaxID=2052 RepID=E0QRW0_9ACTO|nr:FKBP-type peptidyl-prolyl cis-trans isomerase [Mobiluncus mulieris]EEJ54025.1 peptidyl-prolyl cis-trans isomerase, FKBP-type [Mobiluncus mulieris ATCC 35243]EEZ91099.1 peptidyl-prolyl cis-trans isomerase, FKBP-type [Mobiluncus mulieris 28-1]EFM45818.1 peptidyl-prolyl cis-trans isomerase, FKBP-type [Mobiluncus mulieris ATCC 35239]EFN93052.1 peptidyl-prolyl cis-trans isomerase, FKBP-type [Mobiluncus mulieris FB024-16]MBB5846003.1 peptidylprolyl isomerase [Mobiluncus mulieris]